MIDLHYWTTPNGHKITVFLEEAGMPYTIVPVNIGRGEQFAPEFLRIAPNNRIPAIVDHAPARAISPDGAPYALFESGAILLYLADKTNKFIPSEPAARYQVVQWLMWQMGGLGPMLGQNHHFRSYAQEQIPYAIERYHKESQRLYAVLDRQLQGRDHIYGDYSIADMACYPWTLPHERQGIDLADYPNVRRWQAAIRARPAVIRAYERGAQVNTGATIDNKSRAILFGQTAPQLPRR